ncbi:amino acid ABC transporter permease [Rhizobium lentis]|uniref:Amino acid ABC transporter permease n=1 Tax=Rhizobium lentis TaxID=1138194 RepID=A0ABS7ID04_9HYPH|nr:amino acid ABC transporter permease [Rhizobium lentis]MBX5088382.1 amino acid ABC transporter permease [Rhizobium lentis]
MSTKLFWLLVQASVQTVVISTVSIVIGLILAILISACLLSSRRWLIKIAGIYVSFFRGVPLLVQLLLIYNLLPVIGINVPSVVAAIAGLALCTSAYQAENLRGGFESVPNGMIEAADMAGLNPRQTFTRIRVPLAIRMTLPALINEAILILKSSSLISVVGVIELTRMAQDLSASTFQPLQIFAVAGLLYLIINWVVALIGRVVERNLPGQA